MSRFESIEARLNSDQRQREQESMTPDQPRNAQSALMMSQQKQDLVVSVRKLQRIEDTFGSNDDD